MSSEQVDLANSVASVDANKQGRAIELENAGVESRLHEEKKIRRKVDRRLLPMCGALYAVSLIDRLNLPNARLAGMDEALGISIGSRYSIITMVFFIGYILFDFPANFVIRQTGAATFLGTIGFLWGILTIGMGFCKTWGELLLCRIIFGALEGGLFPGIIYLLSCWYIRHEVQVRFSSFYGFGMLISGLSNLIAYGLSKADGLGGLGGWSWIFIFGLF
jgi:MFS family permease